MANASPSEPEGSGRPEQGSETFEIFLDKLLKDANSSARNFRYLAGAWTVVSFSVAGFIIWKFLVDVSDSLGVAAAVVTILGALWVFNRVVWGISSMFSARAGQLEDVKLLLLLVGKNRIDAELLVRSLRDFRREYGGDVLKTVIGLRSVARKPDQGGGQG